MSSTNPVEKQKKNITGIVIGIIFGLILIAVTGIGVYDAIKEYLEQKAI